METNVFEMMNKFFASVYEYVDGVAANYVHPKRLNEIKATRQRIVQLQDLLTQAFRTADSRVVYELVNKRHHPSYQVGHYAFTQPYQKNNNFVYLAFNEVINSLSNYAYYGNTYEKDVVKTIKTWNLRKATQPKNTEYDFVPVVNNFFNNVFEFAKKHAAKYTQDKSKAECQQGLEKLQLIRNSIESITSMPNPEYSNVKIIGGDAVNNSLHVSAKLFTNPGNERADESWFCFKEVLNGIVRYYSENMQDPELILKPIKNWYALTSGNIFAKAYMKMRPMASFGVIGKEKE